jgi:hypothetical protein
MAYVVACLPSKHKAQFKPQYRQKEKEIIKFYQMESQKRELKYMEVEIFTKKRGYTNGQQALKNIA